MEKLSGRDANGNLIRIGDSVLAPEPNESDMYNNEFVGHVSKFKDDGLCTVVDMENNAFDIEVNRLEVLP